MLVRASIKSVVEEQESMKDPDMVTYASQLSILEEIDIDNAEERQ